MVDVAEVKIWGELVGAVRWDEQQQLGFFQYAPEFLRKGWELAPVKMPLSQGSRIYSFPELRKGRDEVEDTFKGLPGLLSDALPDKYGNHLINAWLAQQGRRENSMNPVEKLCFIGTRAMGALEFEPTHAVSVKNSFTVELESLIDIAKKMLDDRQSFETTFHKEDSQAMRDILKIGTSAGGARPKAVIAYNRQTRSVRSGQGNAPKGYEHWMIKLDGVSGDQVGESSGWGRVEYAYYLMALDCGIIMNESSLLEEHNRAHFITKRFDREGHIKHHIQTLCGLQHYDFNDMFNYSYEQVFQTMRLLRLSYPDAEQLFRRMVFNVLATNYDDHTKNIAFRLKKNENWELAPAYDLCFSYDPDNHWVSQQTLSINGKRLGITKEDMMTIAKANSIKKGEQIIEQTKGVVKRWKDYAQEAGVRDDLMQRIHQHLNVLSI